MNKMYNLQKIKKAFAVSFLIFAMSGSSKSQNQEVIIIDSYKPTISDAFKLNDNPKIADSIVEKLNLTYKITPVVYPTSFNVEPIKPAKMIGEPLVKLYRAYLKAGIGTKTTPLAEFYFNNLRSTNESFGVYFKHLSSSGKIKNYGFPGFSDNEAGIYANKFYKNHTLSGEVNYNRNVVHCYGFNPGDYNRIIPNDSIKQRFAKAGGKLTFKSNYEDSTKLNHSFSLKYDHLSDHTVPDDATEDYIGFKGSVDENLNLLGKIFNNQNVGITATLDYYNDINKTDTSFAAVTQLQPHYSGSYNILKFYLGFSTLIKATNKPAKIYWLFPEANFSLNLYQDIFILYGGMTSDMKRNNLMDLSIENPFINDSVLFNITYTSSIFSGGFRGALNSSLSYNACISRSKVNNLPLFVTDPTSPLRNKFTLVYAKTNVFKTHLEITKQQAEKYKVSLAMNFYNYSIGKQAWYKPNMDATISFHYTLENKIILKTDVFAISKVYAKTFDINDASVIIPRTLPGTVDFNLGIEYRYTKELSAFLNFNNVGAVKYKRWYNYPTYGFNVLGGITFSF